MDCIIKCTVLSTDYRLLNVLVSGPGPYTTWDAKLLIGPEEEGALREFRL